MSHDRPEAPDLHRVLIVDDNEDIHRAYRSSLAHELQHEEGRVTPPAARETPDATPDAAPDPAPASGPVNEERASRSPSAHAYLVDSAYRGAEALAAVERASRDARPYAVAFVDVGRPPAWEGVTNIERICQLDPDILIVACSAASEQAWSSVVSRLGHTDHTDRVLLLGKPFDPDAVRQLCSTLVRSWCIARDNRALQARLDAMVAERTNALTDALEEQERELERVRRAAAAASDAKSRFLANMSHELRTPLNGVLGAAQLLSEGGDLDRSQERLVALVRRSGQSLLTVINDLLDVSRIEAGKLRLSRAPFDVRQCVDRMLRELCVMARPGVELAALVAPDVPDIMFGDGHRFQQVLTNLTGNALKFTTHGAVSVTLGYDHGTEPRVRIEVRDTGVGVADDARARIFDPFVQADQTDSRRFAGMGLGLSICRNLVELMGGRIGVDSQRRIGSVFWFDLPADAPRPLPPAPQAHALIVAGRSENRNTLASYLYEAGFASSVVDDVERAAEHLLDEGACRAIFVDRASLAPLVRELALELDLDLESELQFNRALTDAVRDRLIEIAPGAAMVLLQDGDVQQGTDDYPGVIDRLPHPITHEAVMDCARRLRDVGGRRERAETHEERLELSEHRLVARVLVAEDNEINQKIIERMLASLGCEVDIVSNGAEAVRAVGLKHYDLVLMDIQMPITDGIEATLVIRDHTRAMASRVPIVAITASVLEEEREQWLDMGMDDVIAKPMELDTLRELIHRCVSTAS